MITSEEIAHIYDVPAEALYGVSHLTELIILVRIARAREEFVRRLYEMPLR